MFVEHAEREFTSSDHSKNQIRTAGIVVCINLKRIAIAATER